MVVLIVAAFEVLPSLLEEGDEEVDGHEDVLSDLVLSHAVIGDCDCHAGDLLQLELDAAPHIINLRLQALVVSHDLGKHADPVEDGTEDGGDLLHEGVSRKQHVVLLGPVLYLLLLLVELLQTLHVDAVNVEVLGFFHVLGVSNEADAHLWSWNVWQADSSSETLVLLGIVVLETDLQFDGLLELALLAVLQNVFDTLGHLLLS
eukprot:CAMPEP_0202965884 /NCGR_PEP_ID=MMETSP1396-20130829/10028_1 /ASSEMBLY_ACC=CAM_ASM_000872 /TAXON_ID= /ORGANISM="Pseudokeronopsis sp., Strain Brazil" /LENGTH=203 /DNA_ID=CAMNT_0049689073 /DNA_START=89 /DNA_END=699 /DNA_ORIENTATION=+